MEGTILKWFSEMPDLVHTNTSAWLGAVTNGIARDLGFEDFVVDRYCVLLICFSLSDKNCLRSLQIIFRKHLINIDLEIVSADLKITYKTRLKTL